MHKQTPVVNDLLSITRLPLVNRDITQLNIVTGQPQLQFGCAYGTWLNLHKKRENFKKCKQPVPIMK